MRKEVASIIGLTCLHRKVHYRLFRCPEDRARKSERNADSGLRWWASAHFHSQSLSCPCFQTPEAIDSRRVCPHEWLPDPPRQPLEAEPQEKYAIGKIVSCHRHGFEDAELRRSDIFGLESLMGRGVNCHVTLASHQAALLMHPTNQRTAREYVVASLTMRLSNVDRCIVILLNIQGLHKKFRESGYRTVTMHFPPVFVTGNWRG